MSLLLEALVDESTFGAEGLLAPDLTGRRITGRRVVLEWIARSWLQKRGGNRLAPNVGRDIRDLENATLDRRTIESWRVALADTAKKAAIGFVRSIDVVITFENRTTSIAGAVVFNDGSADTLAVTLGAAGALLKFGGA